MTTAINEATAALSEERQKRLTESLEMYLNLLERGENIDIDRVCEEFPEISHVLKGHTPQQAAPVVSQDRYREAKIERSRVSEETNRHEFDPGRIKKLGDFELIEEIGRGGMGIVFKARQISLDRIVALKILSNAAAWDCKQIARFQNEAQAAAQLSHPNIVSVHSVGNENGTYYYSMPLVEGISVEDAMGKLQQIRQLAFDQIASDEKYDEPTSAAEHAGNAAQATLARKFFGRLTRFDMKDVPAPKPNETKGKQGVRAIQDLKYVRASV
ncbi:MAG: protein kinase domain-containing protein, partial [Planctomycetota bacterium]